MNEWPHLLADLRAKRDALSAAIETLETHFTVLTDDDAPSNGHAPTKVRGRAPEEKPRRAAKQTNERTNEQGPRRRAARSLPDQAGPIVEALRKHGSVMKPGDLSTQLGVTPATLRARLAPLVKAKQVEVTGTTRSRRIKLLPTRTAKEVP